MYTVKSNSRYPETVAVTTTLSDALAMCTTVGSDPGNHIENVRTVSYYDEMIGIHEGYVCVNEFYEDDEGFNKNTYMYGKLESANDKDYIVNPQILDGLSSNSYAKWHEALKVFKDKINGLLCLESSVE